MPTIRVRDPVHLVKVLPYELGYHPQRSLLVVGMRGRELVLVQRVDLPTEPASTVAVAEVMVRHLQAARCTAAVVVVFADDIGDRRLGRSERGDDQATDGAARGPAPGGDHAGDGLAAGGLAVVDRVAGARLAASIREAGMELTEHLVVRGGRVYFPACADGCHPDDGVPLPADCDVGPVADFVALGANPCATREELADRVAPADNRTARAVEAAARRLRRHSSTAASTRRGLADWGRFLDTAHPGLHEAPPAATAVARMSAVLDDVTVRDLLLAWLCPGTLDPEAFDASLSALGRSCLPGGGIPPSRKRPRPALPAAREPHDLTAVERSAALVDRLCWLARHTPASLAPGVLTVLASYAWWLGDGALASVALERALSIDPAYRLATLLDQLVSLGIPPPRAEVQALDFVNRPRGGSV